MICHDETNLTSWRLAICSRQNSKLTAKEFDKVEYHKTYFTSGLRGEWSRAQ